MVTNNSFPDLRQFLPYYHQFHEHKNVVTCKETAKVCIIALRPEKYVCKRETEPQFILSAVQALMAYISVWRTMAMQIGTSVLFLTVKL